MTINLYSDQIKAVDTFTRVMRTRFYSYGWMLRLIVNFKPEYINEVIPEGTTAKKYANHVLYQGVLRKDSDMREAFENYYHYNNGHRDEMIKAFVTQDYGSKVRFKKGQAVVVNDGNYYIGILDRDVLEDETETAKLYSDKWNNNLIGEFSVKSMEGIKQWL